jgi:hypothetical protein
MTTMRIFSFSFQFDTGLEVRTFLRICSTLYIFLLSKYQIIFTFDNFSYKYDEVAKCLTCV